MIKLNLYKNKRQGDKNYGKIYARTSNVKPIGLEQLAAHIAGHGSLYTEDVVLGVLKRLSKCVPELCLMGQPVKLDGICIISAQVTSKPANDVESFDIDSHIKTVRLQFRATGATTNRAVTDDATMGYTSLAQRIKKGEIILSSKKGEYILSDDDEGGDEPVVNP